MRRWRCALVGVVGEALVPPWDLCCLAVRSPQLALWATASVVAHSQGHRNCIGKAIRSTFICTPCV